MTKTRYTIRTRGSRTIVRRTPDSPDWPLATGTASPPWEEIKHLFDSPPKQSPKPKRPKRRKKR
jgi:hypothetical protein